MLDRWKDEEALEESGLFGFNKRAKFNLQMCVCLKAAWMDIRQ